MMDNNGNGLGFYEDPKNGYGIVRSRTTQQIRSWEIPRKQEALEIFNKEIGKSEFPGLYILFAKDKKIYVGEAKDLYNRLNQHLKSPEEKIKDWDKAYIINDGRPATQSDFNDTVVRRALELYLINLFRANRYVVVSQGETQQHNAHQQHLVDVLKKELDFFLKRKRVIERPIPEGGQEQIFHDELKKILVKKGKKITKWGAHEGVIDGELTFIRPGSDKPKGWQITFRGRSPGSFIDALQKGKGFLLVSRDGALLIPLVEVKKAIPDPSAYKQDTIDIWITFSDGQAFLSYKDAKLDVTRYKLIQ